MSDFTWEGNTKMMFKKMLEKVPKPFQAMTEQKLLEALSIRAGENGCVTEPAFIEAVKEITPKYMLQFALKNIEQYKSQSQCKQDNIIVTGEVYPLDIGLLMGAILLNIA